MKRRPALLSATLLVVLVALPAMATPALARDPGRVAARAQHNRAVAYWTPARMSSAIARNFVRRSNGDFTHLAASRRFANQVGAEWPDGKGQVYRRTGRVFFTMRDGNGVPRNFICSGSVLGDGSLTGGTSIVLTAGHCVYNEARREFATNWVFIPQYDSNPSSTCGTTAYGCWSAAALFVHQGYASAGSFNTEAVLHDFGFAVVGPGGKVGAALDATVGTLRLTTTGVVGERRWAFGYPASWAGQDGNNDLIWCAGPISEDTLTTFRTWQMRCDMTGGSSGGPWLRRFDDSTGLGAVVSLNSYGYQNVPGAMYGPKFNSTTLEVFSAARSASTPFSNQIVP